MLDLLTGVLNAAAPPAPASGTAIDTTSFFGSAIGGDLQAVTRVIAFPFFLIATFMVFRRLWRKSHRDAFVMFAMVSIIAAFLTDLKLIGTVATTFVGFAGHVFTYIGQL